HIWLGRSGVFDLAYLQPADDAVEKACNRIAAEFLVPTEVLKRHVPQRLQNLDYETVFQGLARNFKVSPLVIAKRVLDMGLINYQFTAKRTA
ncbi:MAG TPA: ImmA/IrrE family metallo-endopeptidase, partial [Firmicutes bacterium]|nr:ImmA/IrrE family metallo-endopeptidase [Bacillota bacterium]